MSKITLTSDIKKARHFTSDASRKAAIAQLQDQHGYAANELYSYVVVRFMGALLFVQSVNSGV